MVLEGLKAATGIGWISGTLLIKSPKGIPVYSSIRSKFFVYTATMHILTIVVGFDFYIKQMVKLKRGNVGMVEKFLNLSITIGAVVFDLYFRICFFLRAKIIPKFLKSLESDKNKLPPLPIEEVKRWKFYRRIIFFTNIYLLCGAILTTWWISKVIPNAMMYSFIPSPYYFVIFFFFAALPLVSSTFLSFALVVATTFHIHWIFEDFCVTFEEQINLYNKEVSIDPSGMPNYSVPNGDTGVNIINSQNPMGKEKLLTKFEHVKLLCIQYDKICGPILLGLMVRSVFVLIHSANAVLLHEGNDEESQAKYIVDIFHFIMELSQLILLEMGYMVDRRIYEQKEKLARLIILMNNIGARDQMKEVMHVVTSWDWELTGGPQFFVIERSLLSGVVSSLMTYVVILFQLNVSDEVTLDNANSTITTTESPLSTTTIKA